MRTPLLAAAALGAIKGGLSVVPTLAQLFIAPKVSPLTMYFWTKSTSTRTEFGVEGG